MNALDALRLILPLAKGYVHAHPVGNNAQHIREAEAALLSNGWQSIETAPMDGTHVILFRPHIQFIGYYSVGGWRINAPTLPLMLPPPIYWKPCSEPPHD